MLEYGGFSKDEILLPVESLRLLSRAAHAANSSAKVLTVVMYRARCTR